MMQKKQTDTHLSVNLVVCFQSETKLLLPEGEMDSGDADRQVAKQAENHCDDRFSDSTKDELCPCIAEDLCKIQLFNVVFCSAAEQIHEHTDKLQNHQHDDGNRYLFRDVDKNRRKGDRNERFYGVTAQRKDVKSRFIGIHLRSHENACHVPCDFQQQEQKHCQDDSIQHLGKHQLEAVHASAQYGDILPSIAKHNNVVLCRLRSSRQSHYVALAEGV